MGSAFTEFGKHYLEWMWRLRLITAFGALLVALFVQRLFPQYSLAPLFLILLLEGLLAAAWFLVSPRVERAWLTHANLLVDIVLVTGMVHFTGGIAGGFASLYIWIALIAALLFGGKWFARYFLLTAIALALEGGFEITGIHASDLAPVPIYVSVPAQLTLLAALLAFARLLSVMSDQLEAKTQSERDKLGQACKRAAQLELVSAITARAGAIQEAQELMDQTVAMVVERFGYQFVSILLLEPDGRQLATAAAAGPLAARFKGRYNHPLDRGIIGWAAQTGRTYYSPDVRRDEHYIFVLGGEDPVRSELAVPLGRGQAIIGVLDVESIELNGFDSSDIAAMETLAEQITVALEKGRALETARKRAAQLALVNRVASRTALLVPPHELLKEAVESIQELFGYLNTAIFWNEPAQQQVSLVAVAGQLSVLPADYRQPWARGIVGHVAATGETYTCRDTASDRYYVPAPGVPGQERVRSEIAIPLREGETTIGVLDIHSEQPEAFDATDVAAMETLADQIVTALQNARLFEQARQSARELEALYQASGQLNSSLSVREICTTCVDGLQQRLGYKYVSLYFCQDGALRLQAHGGYETPLEVIGLDRGIMARAARTRQLIFLPDVSVDPEFIAAHANIQSEIAAPLLRGDEVLGVLNVETQAPHLLRESDATLLRTFANQLAIAIENGRLYARAQTRLKETQALYEFTTALSQTAGVQALGQVALDSLTRLIPFDLAEVSLVDEPSGLIFPIALGGRAVSNGLLADQFRGALHEHSLRRGVGIVGWVAEHGENVRLGDAHQDPRYLPWTPAIRSEICVPLRAGEQVIGVVNLESEQPDAFDEHDERLLSTLANPLAISLVNARLYDQTKQDAEIKAVLLREVSHRVKNNLSAIASLLNLAFDEEGEAREELLRETLGRVESMVLAHTLLAQSSNARLELVRFASQVLSDAVRHLTPPGVEIDLEVTGPLFQITPRQITPIALVLNELATNAIQHGLLAHGRTEGRLRFELTRGDCGAWFILADDGGGVTGNSGLGASSGLGLSLIRTLVEKDLQGSFRLERCEGWTRAIVQFIPED